MASLFASLFVAAGEASSESSALLTFWSRYLWVFPFSVTIASISLLVANLILGSIVPAGVPRELLSGAYLSNGPSIALLSVSTSLGIATPAWVNYLTPAMTLTSAWAYYRSLGPAEQDGISVSRERQQDGDETLVKRIGARSAGSVQSLE